MLKKYGYYYYAGDCVTTVEHEAYSVAIKGHQAKAKCFPLIRRMLSFIPEYLILIPKKLSNIHKFHFFFHFIYLFIPFQSKRDT